MESVWSGCASSFLRRLIGRGGSDGGMPHIFELCNALLAVSGPGERVRISWDPDHTFAVVADTTGNGAGETQE
jgi:hypothetical protein